LDQCPPTGLAALARFGGTTAGPSDSDTSGEILPEKKALN